MGNCVSHPKSTEEAPPKQEPFDILTAFEDIRSVSDNILNSHFTIVSELEHQCKLLAGDESIKFFYSKVIAKDPTQMDTDADLRDSLDPLEHVKTLYLDITSEYSHFLPSQIQDIEYGKIGYNDNVISKSIHNKMKALVLYATQLIERTHLQQQAATVTSVIEIQRQCKSVPMVITSICTTIRHTLQCEYVSLYKVESTRMRQLYPDNCTIHSFNDGILGYVAKKQHFILFNNNKEKESLGIGQLDIEEDMKVDHVQSLICVPIFSKDLKDICGIILIINTHSKFTHLEIDVIQLLGIEIGRILETSGTTLLINDAIENSVNGDVTRSMLHFYRASEINPLMIPAISHSVSSPEAKEVSRIKDHLSQLSDMESQTPPSEIKTSVTSDTEMFTVERTVSDLFMRRRSTLTRMRPITERQDSNSLVDKNRGDPLWRSASTPSKPKKLATAFERDESGYEIKEQVTDTSDVTHADELTDEISKPSNSGPVECVRRNSGNMFEQR
eukprot:365208_1